MEALENRFEFLIHQLPIIANQGWIKAVDPLAVTAVEVSAMDAGIAPVDITPARNANGNPVIVEPF